MRRLFLVLTVAALMTTMMVSPAAAQNVNTGRTGDIENDFAIIQNNSRVGDIDFDDDDDIGDFDNDGTTIRIG